MKVETMTRDNSLKRVRTRRTPPTTPPRKEARIQGRYYKETKAGISETLEKVSVSTTFA